MTPLRLPDVALTEYPLSALPLDWVGMAGIDLPIQLAEPGLSLPIHAKVDVQVDLPDGAAKGIHMSRLYRLLNQLAWPRLMTPESMQSMLAAMVHSHADCLASGARLRLAFDLLACRNALMTQGLAGWKSYPVMVDATLERGEMLIRIQVDVGYSSTCPCSAALARQLVETAFLEQFREVDSVSTEQVGLWIRNNSTLATPHSQRSVASVSVAVAAHRLSLGLLELADRVEAALGTPVQTAVKRADEQEFARLNGSNLMYVEDAARKVQQALAPHYEDPQVFICHKESLHPHDAVAWSSCAAR